MHRTGRNRFAGKLSSAILALLALATHAATAVEATLLAVAVRGTTDRIDTDFASGTTTVLCASQAILVLALDATAISAVHRLDTATTLVQAFADAEAIPHHIAAETVHGTDALFASATSTARDIGRLATG